MSERRHDALFVGRAEELAFLRKAWTRAVDCERCELVTVTGEAGAGKSRLVAELAAGLQVRVVRGRCLPYGEGITYWPVVEVIKQLDALPADPAAAASIRSLLGESEAATLPEEIAWAFRKLLEQSAPLLVVFDDIQWGEQTFLDLIEHVALLSTGAAVLVLCIARPELGEHRPRWPVSLRLEPLPRAQVEALIPVGVPAGLRERIARAAGGNPLFVTEMVAMAADADDEVVVPPTLKALLAARLDQLPAAERSVLERGAVEGELFHRGAVQALADGEDRAQVTARLAALVRKELIRPDRPMLPAEDAFRFCHLLIRDAAYDALPKATRAELHERFADWLDGHGVELVERDELVGYHLEQARRYQSELGRPDDDGTRALGERAAGHLAAAVGRSAARSDFVAVANLIERALALGIADPRERLRLKFELGMAYAATAHRPAEADAILGEVEDEAARLGEAGIEAQARVQRRWNRTGTPNYDYVEAQTIAEGAIETLTELGDERGLVFVRRLLGMMLAGQRHSAAARAELERALVHAEACGDREMRRAALNTLANRYLCGGPTPAGEAIARCEELLRSARGDRLLEATVKRPLALLYAMQARPEEALELLRQAGLVLDELNLRSMEVYRGLVAYAKELAGDRLGAEHELKKQWLYFHTLRGDAVDTRAVEATTRLARLYCDDGRWDKAAEMLTYGHGTPLNRTRRASRLAVEARLKAHHSLPAEALALLEPAIAEGGPEGTLTDRAQIWAAFAEVLRAAGEQSEADAAVGRALELYDQKGNVAAASDLRALTARA